MCFLLLLLSLSFSVLSFVLMYLFVFAEVEVEKRRVTEFEIQVFSTKKNIATMPQVLLYNINTYFAVDIVTYLGVNPYIHA